MPDQLLRRVGSAGIGAVPGPRQTLERSWPARPGGVRPVLRGAPQGTSKAAWITQAYLTDIPQQFPRIVLVNWFDRDKSKLGEADWRFNSSPESLAAYKTAVNSPLYQGELPPVR